MTAPTITIYSGTVPDRKTQAQTEFSTNVANFLPYFNVISPEYNALALWVNDQSALTEQAVIDSAANASLAEASAITAQSSGNNLGAWSNLTGALSPPVAVEHNEKTWQLLNSIADVSASEPGVSSDWSEIKRGATVESISGNVTIEPGVIYNASTGDITIPTLEAGMQFSVHAITDDVRMLNPSNTIKNGNRSIVAGDDLLLRNGQTVNMTAISTTELEVR